MIVTIDGPAGAGKSSTARRVAQRLGFRFLDTGAMYRAVALAALRGGVAWDDYVQLETLCASLDLNIQPDKVSVNGEDVTAAIRTREVTEVVRHVADHAGIRRQMVMLQRRWAEGKDIVTEGRDQGTVVFPDAECKIFLTASAEARARRRWQEMTERGETVDWQEVLAEQNQRDERDTSRPVGRLAIADDAFELTTDGLTQDQVVEQLESVVRAAQT